MKPFKPTSYNSLSPYLIVDGAQKVLDFVVKTFEAKVLRRYDLPDGRVMHVEFQVDDSVVMMGDSSEEFPPQPAVLHVYVADVDEVYRRAIANGATPVKAPCVRDWDTDKRGTFTDPCGNTWSVATADLV